MAIRNRVRCPACGRAMGSGEYQSGGFRCPGCGERLRARHIRREVGIGSAALGILICYLAGFQSVEIFLYGMMLSIPIGFLAIIVILFVKPPLEIDKPKLGDVDFHITGPRD